MSISHKFGVRNFLSNTETFAFRFNFQCRYFELINRNNKFDRKGKNPINNIAKNKCGKNIQSQRNRLLSTHASHCFHGHLMCCPRFGCMKIDPRFLR